MNAVPTLNDLTVPELYLPPPQPTCDVVMKGGITSGIVYPDAMCELARKYRLRQIGGTSAGAIAAAAAAAAEYGREDGAGYPKLAVLPDWLQAESPRGGSNLSHLFQPQGSTRPFFETAIAAMGDDSKGVRRVFGLVKPLIQNYRSRFYAALVLAGLVGAIPWLLGGNWGTIVSIVGWLIVGFITGLAWVLTRAVTQFLGALETNGFGLCKGSGADTDQPSLTDWLADELDSLAGKTDPASPLTFGDLQERGITLQMLTTNLNYGTPYILPFKQRIWYYHPDQLVDYFPSRVIGALNAASPAEVDGGYRQLPDTADLPVIIAVRMTLSFPVLLSAVPLQSFEFSQENDDGEFDLKTSWFSDGGIASNFPLHFFDKPLPSAPTFAINLSRNEELSTDEAENVALPTDNLEGILPRRSEFDSVVGFGRAILDTMQNWGDNTLVRVPGYRDRVATLEHTSTEGGLNLDMDSLTIERMRRRGQWAGYKLRTVFDFDNHRWVRFRSTMELIEGLLIDFRHGLENDQDWPARTYAQMIEGPPPPSYRTGWTEPIAQHAKTASFDGETSLAGIAKAWEENDSSFAEGAPRPTPVLRIMPEN